MPTAPLPIFGTSAKAGIDWVHQRVEAAAMQILVVADEVFVRFPLPQGDNLYRQALVDFVRSERFPTVQDAAQCVARHRPDNDMGMVGHHNPRAQLVALTLEETNRVR